ncbi:unnamed protein product [Trichobilharzia szidati]|nr:unnamed protein product [Trichobilharzia szidati]
MSPDAFRRDVANYGDCVIIDLGKFKNLTVILKRGDVSQTRFGAMKHDDCVGRKFGSKIQTSRGFVHILPLSPVLWSETLPHRTQIIYPCDASLIIGGLDLSPGKWVFEAGTGSGSLTHFLAQAILPHGRVYTFDFHTERVDLANEEFNSHSLGDVVKVSFRDVCSEYFPNFGSEMNPNGVDAVILDLPRPWLVIPHLTSTFRPESGGRVCLFSPCIEQVQRSCAALLETGFVHLTTMECLEREYDVSRTTLNIPNMGQLGASVCLKDGFKEYMNSYSKGAVHLLPPPKIFERINHNCKRSHSDADRNGSSSQPNDSNQLYENVQITSSTKNQFTWEPILQPKTAGHTGYLTFATWMPTIQQNFATVQCTQSTGSPD